MPTTFHLEDGYSSDSYPDETFKYEGKHRIPKAGITDANLDHILRISTGVHRGVSIIVKPLLKTGDLITSYTADMAQLVRSMTTWVKAHKKELAVILAGIIIFALCLAMPAILGAIGFGAQGPIIGSMAASWQASIGSVAAGSLFAFLQSAAMGGAAMACFMVIGLLGALVAIVGAATTIDLVKEKCREAVKKSAKGLETSFQRVMAGAVHAWQRYRGLFSKERKYHDE